MLEILVLRENKQQTLRRNKPRRVIFHVTSQFIRGRFVPFPKHRTARDTAFSAASKRTQAGEKRLGHFHVPTATAPWGPGRAKLLFINTRAYLFSH